MAWAASTVAREAEQQDPDIIAVLMPTGTTIYQGDLVVTKAADGLAYSVYETGEQYDSFLGVAAETVTAANATTYIKLHTQGVFAFVHAAAAQVNIGAIAYTDPSAGSADVIHATSQPATHSIRVGKIMGRTGTTHLLVKIAPHFVAPNPTA